MRPLLVESRIAALAGAAPAGTTIVPVAAARRRRPLWEAMADAVVDAGPGALALVRPGECSPEAAALAALAAATGLPVVRLPADERNAARVVAVAAREGTGDADLVRRLEALAGAADRGLPALRPAVLARWAGIAWRRCARCAGGGLPGCACGRCGARIAGAIT
jgi:hypothetical protein